MPASVKRALPASIRSNSLSICTGFRKSMSARRRSIHAPGPDNDDSQSISGVAKPILSRRSRTASGTMPRIAARKRSWFLRSPKSGSAREARTRSRPYRWSGRARGSPPKSASSCGRRGAAARATRVGSRHKPVRPSGAARVGWVQRCCRGKPSRTPRSRSESVSSQGGAVRAAGDSMDAGVERVRWRIVDDAFEATCKRAAGQRDH